MKAAPRKSESLEKYKSIVVTQPGNPEYKQFTEKYEQTRKGRWKLSGTVQVSPSALKNPRQYPDLADRWMDGKPHRLGAAQTFSSDEVLEQLRYEFKYARLIKKDYLRVTGIVDDKKSGDAKPGCWYAVMRRKAARRKKD